MSEWMYGWMGGRMVLKSWSDDLSIPQTELEGRQLRRGREMLLACGSQAPPTPVLSAHFEAPGVSGFDHGAGAQRGLYPELLARERHQAQLHMAEGRQAPPQRLADAPVPRPKGAHHHPRAHGGRRPVQLCGGEPHQPGPQPARQDHRVQ